jgi:hypothetical protein
MAVAVGYLDEDDPRKSKSLILILPSNVHVQGYIKWNQIQRYSGGWWITPKGLLIKRNHKKWRGGGGYANFTRPNTNKLLLTYIKTMKGQLQIIAKTQRDVYVEKVPDIWLSDGRILTIVLCLCMFTREVGCLLTFHMHAFLSITAVNTRHSTKFSKGTHKQQLGKQR